MRADLRLADLGTGRVPSKLMNVKVPASTADRIDAMAAALGCSKTAAVIALFNEGLDIFKERWGEFTAPGPRRVRRGRPAVLVEASEQP